MGDRGQVKIISSGNPDLYLYTHWGATGLPTIVANALNRGRSRWNDDEYLNRIIFSEMIQDEVMSELSYGIGFGLHGDVWRVVEINYDNQTVSVQEINYDDCDMSIANLDEFESKIKWDSSAPMPYELFIAEYSTQLAIK